MGIFFLGVNDSQKKSVPSAPEVVSQSDSGSERAFNNGASYLTFNEPSFNGKLPIIEYDVTAVAEDDTTSSASLLNLNPYVFTGLRSGVKYRYKARARNGLGFGPFSNLFGPVPATTVPGVPTSLSAIDLRTGGGILINWAAPANGGLSVTGYTIYPSTGGQIETNDPSTSYTFTGTVGSPVTFTIAAKNNNGRGAQSAGSASVTPTNPPPPPTTQAPVVTGPTIGFTTTASATGTSANNQWGINVSWVGFGYASYRITGAGCDTGVINGTATNRVVTCAAAQCDQTVSATVILYAGTGGSGASSSSTANGVVMPTCPTVTGPVGPVVPDPCAGTTTVPNISGLTVTEANTLLSNAGLSSGGSTGTVSTSTQSQGGKVAGQSPAPGSTVAKCSTVTYTTYSYTAPTSNCNNQTQGPIYSGSCPDGSCSGCTSYRVYYGQFTDGSSDTSRICRYEGLGCSTPGPYWGPWVDAGATTTYGCDGQRRTTTTCSSAQTRFYYNADGTWNQNVAPETQCVGTTTTTSALTSGYCGYTAPATTAAPCSICETVVLPVFCGTCSSCSAQYERCYDANGVLCSGPTFIACVGGGGTATTTTQAPVVTTTQAPVQDCTPVPCCYSASACSGCGGVKTRNPCTGAVSAGYACNDCPPTVATTVATTQATTRATTQATTQATTRATTSSSCACRDFRGRCAPASFCGPI